MLIYLAVETKWLPGTEPVSEGPYTAVFEKDGETDYSYALDTRADDNPIQDALHVYNVRDISDRDNPSTVRIGWFEDHLKAVILINDYPHAVLDFHGKRGYCRTGLQPASGTGLSEDGHDWCYGALELFA